jgi:SAM-dependent methyltransferase
MKKILSNYRLAALFVLSVTLIAYELAVMRTFAVGSWSNFGSMVISIALLGNGLAGTLLTFLSKRIKRNLDGWLATSAILLGPAMAGAHVVAQLVPFNPVMIASDWTQLGWIGVYYLIYSVPFFIGAVFIGATFIGLQDRIHRLYFWNMFGSGLGGFVILGLMYLFPPSYLIGPLVVLAMFVSLMCLIEMDASGERLKFPAVRTSAAVVAMALSLVLLSVDGRIKVSPFKPVSYARQFPDAKLVYHSYGPTGEYSAYQSSFFHFAPGLSDNASVNVKTMPSNAFLGLYIDGDGPIGVMRKLSPDEEAYMDYLPMAGAYLLLDKPSVLELQLGGGVGVFNALYHGASSVSVVEPDPALIHMLKDVPYFRNYNGDLLRDPRVHLYNTESRAFTAGSGQRFDLVEIGLIDSVGLSQTGGYPLAENYTYTVEGIQSYLKSLKPDGILSITVWNRLDPPRNVPKLLTTVTQALMTSGVKNPGNRVFVFDYLLSTATILVKNSPFTDSDRQKLLGFLARTSFLPAYYEGMPAPNADPAKVLAGYAAQFKPSESAIRAGGAAAAGPSASGSANSSQTGSGAGQSAAAANSGSLLDAIKAASASDSQAPVDASTPENLYYFTMQELLSGKSKSLYDKYFFNILPATDNRPYYTGYVKPQNIGAVVSNIRDLSEEWGYILQLGTLVLSIFFGALIVLIPLAGRWRELFMHRKGTLRVIVYFSALGIGYMLVEMFLIQRLVFFLADPIFSNSVVITAMLVISGLGALVAGRYKGPKKKLVGYAALGIGLSMLFYMLVMPGLLDSLLGLPLLLKMLIAVVFIAPGAFFLGMPFPTGLSSLSTNRDGLIPWAWGMNGALSVTGTALAKLVSISWGFSVLLVAVIALYFIGYLTYSGNEEKSA